MNEEALKQLRWQVEKLKHYLEVNTRPPGERSPVYWDDERAIQTISTTAIHDDPPEGWGRAKLAQFARGRAYGEDIVALNAIQYTEFMLDIFDHPERWTDEAIAKQWGATVEQVFGDKAGGLNSER